MSLTPYATSDKLPKRAYAPRAASRCGWRWWLSCFAALAFVLLVSAAETHHHTGPATEHDCAICMAAADKVGGTSPPPAPVVAVQLQPYLLFLAAPCLALYLAPRLQPPGCGPPGHSD